MPISLGRARKDLTLALPLVLLRMEYDGGMKEGPIKYVREFLGKVKGQVKMDEEKKLLSNSLRSYFTLWPIKDVSRETCACVSCIFSLLGTLQKPSRRACLI